MPAPLDTAGPIPLPPRNSWTSMADTKKRGVYETNFGTFTGGKP